MYVIRTNSLQQAFEMSGHVVRSPISRMREATVPFCSALLIYFCVQVWALRFQKNIEKLERGQGSTQDGQMCTNHNLGHVLAHSVNTH